MRKSSIHGISFSAVKSCQIIDNSHSILSFALELAPVPCDHEGALGVREADPRARQRFLDFLLLLQRVVVSSEQELVCTYAVQR